MNLQRKESSNNQFTSIPETQGRMKKGGQTGLLLRKTEGGVKGKNKGGLS